MVTGVVSKNRKRYPICLNLPTTSSFSCLVYQSTSKSLHISISSFHWKLSYYLKLSIKVLKLFENKLENRKIYHLLLHLDQHFKNSNLQSMTNVTISMWVIFFSVNIHHFSLPQYGPNSIIHILQPKILQDSNGSMVRASRGGVKCSKIHTQLQKLK